MQHLVGKTILVGREPQTNRLLLCVEVDGQMRNKSLNIPVPNSVSRCVPARKDAHCKIEVKTPSSIFIHNLKNDKDHPNHTYVNSQDILSKSISPTSHVQLGADHFDLDVDRILACAIQLVTSKLQVSEAVSEPAKPQSYNLPDNTYLLDALKPVWENYQRVAEEISKQHANIVKLKQWIQRGAMVVLPILFGSLVKLFFDNDAYTVISVIVSLVIGFFVSELIKDPSIERKKALDARMNQDYVCPNPQCRIPFGKHNPYDVVSRRRRCNNCQCHYVTSESLAQNN